MSEAWRAATLKCDIRRQAIMAATDHDKATIAQDLTIRVKDFSSRVAARQRADRSMLQDLTESQNLPESCSSISFKRQFSDGL